MGEQKVSLLQDDAQMQNFVRLLLNDVRAMEYMLENDWFETGITRIGAEQEMCMVHNDNLKPACIAPAPPHPLPPPRALALAAVVGWRRRRS